MAAPVAGTDGNGGGSGGIGVGHLREVVVCDSAVLESHTTDMEIGAARERAIAEARESEMASMVAQWASDLASAARMPMASGVDTTAESALEAESEAEPEQPPAKCAKTERGHARNASRLNAANAWIMKRAKGSAVPVHPDCIVFRELRDAFFVAEKLVCLGASYFHRVTKLEPGLLALATKHNFLDDGETRLRSWWDCSEDGETLTDLGILVRTYVVCVALAVKLVGVRDDEFRVSSAIRRIIGTRATDLVLGPRWLGGLGNIAHLPVFISPPPAGGTPTHVKEDEAPTPRHSGKPYQRVVRYCEMNILLMLNYEMYPSDYF